MKFKKLNLISFFLILFIISTIFIIFNKKNNFENDFVFKYIHNIPGSGINVVFSSVHGGNLTDERLIKRFEGNGTDYLLFSDLYTIELMKETNLKLKELFNISAHMVYCSLKREYIDLNRSPENINSFQDPNLKGFHESFYKIISNYIQYSKYTLVLDFHGFGSLKRPIEEQNISLFIGTRNNKSLTQIEKIELIKILSNNSLLISPNHLNIFTETFQGDYNLKRFDGNIKYRGIQLEFSDKIRLPNYLNDNNNLNNRNLSINNIINFIKWWLNITNFD